MLDIETEPRPPTGRRLPDPSSTTCPKCGSDDTRSFQLVYAEGTSQGRISAGSYTFGGGVTATSGRTNSQSLLAARTSPPVEPSPSVIGLAMLPLLLLFLAVAINIVVSIVFVALICVWLYRHYQPKRRKYKEDIAEWSRSWMCIRCGHAWRRVTFPLPPGSVRAPASQVS